MLVDSLDRVEEETRRLLGSMLITKQSSAPGLPVNVVWSIEAEPTSPVNFISSALVDRESRRVLFMASSAGGMNIEEVAAETPKNQDDLRSIRQPVCRVISAANSPLVWIWRVARSAAFSISCSASITCSSPAMRVWSRSIRWW